MNEPTNTWKCPQCNTEVERYRGEATVNCFNENCDAEFNASGQLLRAGWRDNPSWYDDEIGDMEGFEIASLMQEGVN